MTGDAVSLRSVLHAAEGELRAGRSAAARVWATGFEPLDTYLGGGIRGGELILLGGPQGLGKTSFVLQVLRHVVAEGQRGLIFSFEHDAQTLLERMIALEAAEAMHEEGVPLRLVRQAMQQSADGRSDLAERLADAPGAAAALQTIAEYGDRFALHRSSGRTTTVEVIRDEVLALVAKKDPPVVVVDYLQKVAVPGAVDDEQRVTHIVEALKDLALEVGIPVLAVVAADRDGIFAGKRLRVHHLRGSSALAYEADVVLLLNDKYDVVARHHLVYDTSNAERYRNYAVVSIEKNRSGLDKLDLEFRKHFDQGRFDRQGGAVTEQLVDERVFVE